MARRRVTFSTELVTEFEDRSGHHFVVGSVITKEKPIVHALYPKFRGLYCDWCLNLDENLQFCQNCFAYQLCKPCSNEERPKANHSSECAHFKDISHTAEFDHNFLSFYLRLVAAFVSQDEGISLVSAVDEDYCDINQIYSRTENYTFSWDIFKVLTDSPEYPAKEFIRFLSQIPQPINDIYNKPIAQGVYHLPDNVKLSCSPNCALVFDGNALQVRSMKEHWTHDDHYISPADLEIDEDNRLAVLDPRNCSCRSCRVRNGILGENGIDLIKFCQKRIRTLEEIAYKKSLGPHAWKVIVAEYNTLIDLKRELWPLRHHPDLVGLQMLRLKAYVMAREVPDESVFSSINESIGVVYGQKHSIHAKLREIKHQFKKLEK